MNNNIVKLEPNKIIEAQFYFEVECDFCKTTFIIASNNNERLQCCPYCGYSFYKESEPIKYSHGVYGDIRSITASIRQNRFSIESINVDSIETNNAYSVECKCCDESLIIDCGEDIKPKFCPYCETFYVDNEFIRKIKTNNELTYSYDNTRFGSFPRITHDVEHYYNTIQEFLSTMATDLMYDDNEGE